MDCVLSTAGRRHKGRTVKKTPLAARFTKQLVRVNDQVCFAALQQWEFTQRLNLYVDDRPHEFTTDAFPENPFAEVIYRRVGDLPKFSNEAEQIALQMGIIAAAEYVLAYIEEVQKLRDEVSSDEVEPIRDDAEEEQLRLKISRWCGGSPTAGYFRTLGYFRLLRNHYAHVNETPSPAFSSYIRSYGTPLNAFWNNGVTDIHQIVFRTLHTTSMTPDLAFGVMNLLRVSVQHIDEMVAETLNLDEVARWIVLQIRTEPRARQFHIKRMSSKVATRLRMDWNIEVPLPIVIELVEDIILDTE